jgi:hypothetical protein
LSEVHTRKELSYVLGEVHVAGEDIRITAVEDLAFEIRSERSYTTLIVLKGDVPEEGECDTIRWVGTGAPVRRESTGL